MCPGASFAAKGLRSQPLSQVTPLPPSLTLHPRGAPRPRQRGPLPDTYVAEMPGVNRGHIAQGVPTASSAHGSGVTGLSQEALEVHPPTGGLHTLLNTVPEELYEAAPPE